MGDGVRWMGGSGRGGWRTGYFLIAVFGRVVECGRMMDGCRQVDVVRGRRKALPYFLVSIIFSKDHSMNDSSTSWIPLQAVDN